MRADLEARGGAPFVYEGTSGLVTVASYYEASANVLEDDRILNEWATDAVRAAISAKAGVSHRAPTRDASSALKRPRKSRAMA
jgi:TfoX/Sxy family transcriptional regulator of competence genes